LNVAARRHYAVKNIVFSRTFAHFIFHKNMRIFAYSVWSVHVRYNCSSFSQFVSHDAC